MICGWVRAIEGVELFGWVAHVDVRSAAAEVCRNGGEEAGSRANGSNQNDFCHRDHFGM